MMVIVEFAAGLARDVSWWLRMIPWQHVAVTGIGSAVVAAVMKRVLLRLMLLLVLVLVL